jgi:segregation and condensation protein B
MKKEDYLAAIESMLFVSQKPVKLEEISRSLNMDANSVQELLNTLEEILKDSGINIAVSKKGFTIMPNEKYRRYFSAFLKKKKSSLSREVLEVVAILLKEKAPKEKLDKLRGVNNTRSLNILIRKGYVKKEIIEGKIFYSLTDVLFKSLKPETKNILQDSGLFKEKE